MIPKGIELNLIFLLFAILVLTRNFIGENQVLFLRKDPNKIITQKNGKIILDNSNNNLRNIKDAYFKIEEKETGKKIKFNEKTLCVSRNFEDVRLCDHRKAKNSFNIWSMETDDNNNLRLRIDDHCLVNSNNQEFMHNYLIMKHCSRKSYIWKIKNINDMANSVEDHYSESSSRSDDVNNSETGSDKVINLPISDINKKNPKVNIKSLNLVFPGNKNEELSRRFFNPEFQFQNGENDSKNLFL